ncbi:hypothetical protein PAXRUDRAFT_769089, partial [Paxillus rubicundulus Ve08.2h10]
MLSSSEEFYPLQLRCEEEQCCKEAEENIWWAAEEKAQREAQKKAEEEAQKKVEEEAKRIADEEARKKQAEEEEANREEESGVRPSSAPRILRPRCPTGVAQRCWLPCAPAVSRERRGDLK